MKYKKPCRTLLMISAIALALLASSALLTSCDGDVSVAVFVGDLLDLISGKENAIYANASIISDNLTEKDEMDSISNLLGGVSNQRMVKKGYSDVYAFDVKIPILGPDSDTSQVGQNDLLFLKLDKTDAGFALAFHVNRSAIDRISSWTREKYYQTFDPSGVTISLNLNNDTRNDFKCVASSVYMDTKAYPFETTILLSRRDSKVIELSEVLANASLVSDDNYAFIKFANP